MNTRTLFLGWQTKNKRFWYPVGRLDVLVVKKQWYVFRYIKGAIEAKQKAKFFPLPEFPKLERHYISPELFSIFANRVIAANRPDRKEYLNNLGLTEQADQVEILSINGGKRVTDTYRVFPKLRKSEDDSFTCRFFLHGWSYVEKQAQGRIKSLEIGEDLQIELEPENPVDSGALKILTGDDSRIGYVPRHLNKDLSHVVRSQQVKRLSVIQVNEGFRVPSNQRVLLEMEGSFTNYVPMEGEEFKPLAEFPQHLPKFDVDSVTVA